MSKANKIPKQTNHDLSVEVRLVIEDLQVRVWSLRSLLLCGQSCGDDGNDIGSA